MKDANYSTRQIMLAWCHREGWLSADEVADFLKLDRGKNTNDAYPLIDGVHDATRTFSDRVKLELAKRRTGGISK